MARKPSLNKKAPRGVAGERYQVVRTLGQGGGGEVFLVKDMAAGGRTVALKSVSGVKRDAPALIDLKNEFSTLSLLHHPNLAGVYDFGVTEQGMYFTSEWIDGSDLVAAASGRDLNTVFQLIVQILRALDFLHHRGVLHLDLKPANILVTDPNRTGNLTVKLIDFGIAQWKKYGRAQSEGFSGSPPYTAPEALEEKPASPASDIYSLGMLLHLIFAKRFPFATQNPMEILMQQTYRDPEPPAQLDAALPRAFADWLHRMVARDPAARFSSAREVLDALNRALGENFTLRSAQVPVRVLEESDHLFHSGIFEALKSRVDGGAKLELVGPAGAGKSQLLERLKIWLQLRGNRPLQFRDAPAWRDYFKDFPDLKERPVLADWDQSPPAIDLARIAGAAVWSNLASSGANAEVVEIPELDAGELKKYFAAEIPDAPEALPQWILETGGPIYPGSFGQLLQAMREEGLIAWSSAGWSWHGDANLDAAALTQRHAERARKMKQDVRSFLEGSGLVLPASALEGLLGFEAGALSEALFHWGREAWLRSEMHQGVPHYAAKRELAGESIAAGESSPDAIAEQLDLLYQQGKFGAGIRWFEALLRKNPEQAPRIRLVAGRHLVADGQAARSLDALHELRFESDDDQALLCETRARALNLLGRNAEAAANLEIADKKYLASGNRRGSARVDNMNGLVMRALRRLPEAEKILGRAVEHAAAAGDWYCAGLAQANLALVYQEQGKFDAAYAGYQASWKFAERDPHPVLLQSLYQKWINMLHHGGRSAEAEAACYQWMKLAIRNGDRDQQAIALNYLSLIAGKKGQFELKASYLDQAIALLEEKKEPRFKAQLFINRAYLNWSREKYLPAQLDAEAALNIATAWPEDRVLAWIYIILGKIYRDRPQADWEQSALFFEKAHGNILKNQIRESIWEVQYNRALLEKKRGDFRQAKAFLLEAQAAIEDFVEQMPELLRASYLRDRKLETVLGELATLPSP